MIAYRIDKRDFDIDDMILPQDLYQHNLDNLRAFVEETLEINRPKNKSRRNSILMLFKKFEDAKSFNEEHTTHWSFKFG